MRNWFSNFSSPDQADNLKPHVFQRAALAGMLVMVMLSFALANIHSIIWISSDWLVSTILPAVVTDATNAARAEESLPPLVRNTTLDRAAQMKAEDMAEDGYFAHWSPDGTSPWYWFGQAGYSYLHAGENLAVHFTDSSAVVEAWLDSPSHRANIMNGNYSEIGIGTAQGEYEDYDTVFVVQLFGTPAAEAPVAAAVTPEETVVEPEIQAEPEPEPEPEDVDESPNTELADETEGEEVTVSVTDDGTVVYESYASTENEGVVLAETDEGERIDQKASFVGRLATSPQLALQIAYAIIGLIIFGLIMAALVLEWRRRHPVQMVYSAGLLAVMILLLFLHTVISSGAVIA